MANRRVRGIFAGPIHPAVRNVTRTLLRSLLGTLVVIVLADPAAAQPTRPSLTVSAGVAHGGGGDPTLTERNVPALTGLLTVRPSDGSRLIVGLGAGVQGLNGSLVCNLRPDGGCAESYPGFAHVAALGGWELVSDAGAALRVMAGPALVVAGRDDAAPALHALADVSTPPLWHVALVVSARATLIPSYRGSSYRVTTAGLGVRVGP
jgi:hypothetical protein